MDEDDLKMKDENMVNPFPDTIRRVAVLAPASQAESERVESGKKILEQWGREAIVSPHANGNDTRWHVSGEAIDRAKELETAWMDPAVDLILAARGGFGSAHLIPLLNWRRLARRPMPLVGFSDITALHLAMLKYGAGVPIAGPVALNLKDAATDELTMQSLSFCLENAESAPSVFVEFLKNGSITAPVIPVNLAVCVTLLGTPYFPDTTGKILILEDLNEPVYKLDRYLTQLEQTGVLPRCAGLVFGAFNDCGDEKQRTMLFARIAETINGPVATGLPFRHGFPLYCMRYGAIAEISATKSSFRIVKNK